MNRIARIPYSAVGALARAAAAITPGGSSKTARALSGRRRIGRRYAEWAEKNRDPARPLLWVHAPSVGEGLQALPVIQLFRARNPDAQLAYTFYSPSAEAFARTAGADFCDYLPFDTAHDARVVLDALRPTALFFSKLDVWPVLVEAASRRAVKLGMLSATMPESSKRRSSVARLALANAYAALDAVGAISEGDARRLVEAGVRDDRITLTGDTRYDQAWLRAQTNSSERSALLQPLRAPRFTMVAGSTWPSDEERLLPAWLLAKAVQPELRLVIAPHELSGKHLDAIESWARKNNLSSARLGGDLVSRADIIVVDRYGVLGDLYALADIAYVGGGFRGAGLHSLLEPAAFGAPVVIGPRHPDNRDARLLMAAGGAVRCTDAASIANQIRRWLDAPDSLAHARSAAQEVVFAGLGAADLSVSLVEKLMFWPSVSYHTRTTEQQK
jgi:3-deoxy-D-manno-octulosonic-acid transferase